MPIKLENASKRSGNQWIFRDVSFEVADGEVFAIFGPNGSGKREIISSISGDAANNSIWSRLFRSVPASGNEQFTENLNKIDSADEKLLLDDPFAGLDLHQRTELSNRIRKAAKDRNLPVVISSPDFADALLSCDRAALIADGYIQQIGTPEQLYREPHNRLTAAFTGRNNLIEARRLTSSKSEMPEFQTIAGEHRLFTQRAELRGLGAIHKSAYLTIRPEQIVLSFGASFPEDNLLKGVITKIEFSGPATYMLVNCSGLALESMVTRLIGLNVGDECMVGLPPDRIRVLAD